MGPQGPEAREIRIWQPDPDGTGKGALVTYRYWTCAPLTAGLAWCRGHRPEHRGAPVLLWGDPRLGNLVVDDNRSVTGVLDWEMASVGPPEMDLAWYLALDAAMVALVGRSVPGFPDHATTVARYEERRGGPAEQLDYHLTFALTRALAISECHGRLRAGGEQPAPDPLAPLLAARLAAD